MGVSDIVELDLEKFSKVCGLLSSNHDGERAAAALKATAMINDAGLTWEHVARKGATRPQPAPAPAPARPEPPQAAAPSPPARSARQTAAQAKEEADLAAKGIQAELRYRTGRVLRVLPDTFTYNDPDIVVVEFNDDVLGTSHKIGSVRLDIAKALRAAVSKNYRVAVYTVQKLNENNLPVVYQIEVLSA